MKNIGIIGLGNIAHRVAKGILASKHANLYAVASRDKEKAVSFGEMYGAQKACGSYEELFKTGFSFDTPDAINLPLMREHLLALKNGEKVRSPKYNFVTCESTPDGEEKSPAKIILTEGLYVLNEAVRDIMDVKVYVFTPLEVLKERWYKRAESRGKTGEAADLQFKDVNKTAQQYIRPTYQIADVIINGLVSQDYIVEITNKIFKSIKELF